MPAIVRIDRIAHRYSILTLRPSENLLSLKPWRNAAMGFVRQPDDQINT
jgi:hypothetical protein